MNSTFFLLDLIALVCGIYCFYTWIRLLAGKKLFQNAILVPREKKPSDCLDEAEYIRYLSPRLAVVAVTTSVYGVLQFANTVFGAFRFMSTAWSFVPLGLVLAALVWYAVCSGKANRKYFNL